MYKGVNGEYVWGDTWIVKVLAISPEPANKHDLSQSPG